MSTKSSIKRLIITKIKMLLVLIFVFYMIISLAAIILTPGDIRTLSPIEIFALALFLFHEQICVIIFLEVLKCTLLLIQMLSP